MSDPQNPQEIPSESRGKLSTGKAQVGSLARQSSLTNESRFQADSY